MEENQAQQYICFNFSIKGEVLGSCKDFRINNFSLDSLGIIRLGPSCSCIRFQREASGNGLESVSPTQSHLLRHILRNLSKQVMNKIMDSGLVNL